MTVILDEKDCKTTGGLVLPDNFSGVFLTGTVRAVGSNAYHDGDGEHNTDRGVRPGDRVLIAQHVERDSDRRPRIAPYPTLEDDGMTVILLDYTEILGIITPTVN